MSTQLEQDDSEWVDNESHPGAFDIWDNLDLDWMSKPDVVHSAKAPSTAAPVYQTKVYQQSISLRIRLKTNESENGFLSYLEPLRVGPWKLPKESLPFIFGSVVGFCILLLLAVTLTLYVCLQKRQGRKQYSVKSDSTPSSGLNSRSPKSSKNGSRDTLVLINNSAGTEHQTIFPSSKTFDGSYLLFDHSFDFQFDMKSSSEDTSPVSFPPGATTHLHSFQGTHSVETSSPPLENNLDTVLDDEKISKEGSSTALQESCSRRYLDNRHSCMNEIFLASASELPVVLTPSPDIETGLEPSVDNDVVNHNRTAVEGLANNGRTNCTSVPAGTDLENGKKSVYEELSQNKTRSLPAWVRSKTRPPLSSNNMFASMYDRDHLKTLDRKWNRMGKKDAKIIALNKSQLCVYTEDSNGSCKLTPFDTEIEFQSLLNTAVVFSSERTDL